MSYQQVHDGDWNWMSRKFKLACCDCGLVHKVKMKTRKGRLWLQIFRDDRATAAMRRRMGVFK